MGRKLVGEDNELKITIDAEGSSIIRQGMFVVKRRSPADIYGAPVLKEFRPVGSDKGVSITGSPQDQSTLVWQPRCDRQGPYDARSELFCAASRIAEVEARHRRSRRQF